MGDLSGGLINTRIKEFNERSTTSDEHKLRQHPKDRFMPIRFDRDESTQKPFIFHKNQPMQDFYNLKQRCLTKGTFFEDKHFKPCRSSLGKGRSKQDPTIEWLRPREICSNPKFFVDGPSRFDVCQGSLQNCWFLTALANLTANQRLFKKTVPSDNSFEDDEYAGIFHFRFWQFGEWVDVVIDDRLPTRNRKLIYVKSSAEDEFWSALLEKAYAKLHGSYGALNSGTAREAMQDFTGGITEEYKLSTGKHSSNNLFEIIHSGFKRGSMFACSIKPESTESRPSEAPTPEGLVKGHSYSITKTYIFEPTRKQLIRLRNPWGDGIEWNGAWSDQCKKWETIPKAQREQLGLTVDADGEFWMDYKDFVHYFDRVEICHLNPDMMADPEAGQRGWQISCLDGEWIKGSTAGGCINNKETFWTNPQYVIRLDQPDQFDPSGMCTIIIALMQKHRRAKQLSSLTIGFDVYQITDEDLRRKPVPMKFFQQNHYTGRSTYINAREVSLRLQLSPGIYLIVPSSWNPNDEGEFLVRIFTELSNCLEENDCMGCFGSVDDRVYTSLLEDKQWDQMVRQFYDLADRMGTIDDIALSAILNKFFFGLTEPKKLLRFKKFLLSTWISLLKCKFRTNGTTASEETLLQQISMQLISRVNPTKSARLNHEQFRMVIRDVQQWHAVFQLYDLDGSGLLDRMELGKALNSSGYNLSKRVLNEFLKRSREKDMKGMSLMDFVLCAVEGRKTIEKNYNNILLIESGKTIANTQEILER